MRITNGMMTSKYSRNLNSALSDLDYYNNRATTLRKFDKVSEDPVAASKAFRLRRAYYENEYYQSNTENAENQLLTAETAMRTINTYIQEISSGDVLQSITSTTGKEERNIIAAKIRKSMDALIGTANTQYGDKYVFGGTDTTKPPLEVLDDGTLLYRGVDVNTGKLVKEDGAIVSAGGFKVSFGKDNLNATGDNNYFNGFEIEIISDSNPANPVAQGTGQVDVGNKKITINVHTDVDGKIVENGTNLQDILRGSTVVNGTLPADVKLDRISVSGNLTDKVTLGTSAKASDTIDLDMLANEKVFIDLGMGLTVDKAGNVNAQSAFNIGLPAIKFLGHGFDANGNPCNVYNLLGKIADELEKDDFSVDKVKELGGLLDKQETNLLSNITELGVRTNFLISTKTRFEDSKYNLSVQIDDVEYLDADEAIMDFKMQEYIYKAALSMGSRVIQPSFLDFMR